MDEMNDYRINVVVEHGYEMSRERQRRDDIEAITMLAEWIEWVWGQYPESRGVGSVKISGVDHKFEISASIPKKLKAMALDYKISVETEPGHESTSECECANDVEAIKKLAETVKKVWDENPESRGVGSVKISGVDHKFTLMVKIPKKL